MLNNKIVFQMIYTYTYKTIYYEYIEICFDKWGQIKEKQIRHKV